MTKARKRNTKPDTDDVKGFSWESFMKDFTGSRENIKMELENLKHFRFELEQTIHTIDSGIEHIEIGLKDISDECIYNK